MGIGNPDEPGSDASPPCFGHDPNPSYVGGRAGHRRPLASAGFHIEGHPVARLLPERPFPPYAYLPGRFPHPVRDPRGHSSKANAADWSLPGKGDPQALCWGADLFNHGYYWEAHEAWEELWRLNAKGGTDRDLLHGLILMAAAGVKLREGKWDAARRHGTRAAVHLRSTGDAPIGDLAAALGWWPPDLAAEVEEGVLRPARPPRDAIAFSFALGRAARLEP